MIRTEDFIATLKEEFPSSPGNITVDPQLTAARLNFRVALLNYLHDYLRREDAYVEDKRRAISEAAEFLKSI